jgi:aminoglycoside phosphotransferase (APT) family kinase protein
VENSFLKPEAALNNWPAWSCPLRSRPVIVAELAGGRTNRSYLLEAGGARLVMRLNTPGEILPGVNRAREIRIWQAASQAGLAPPVLHSDEQAGLLVTEYIEGTTPDPSDVDGALINRLVDLLSRVHALDIEVTAIDYAAHIEEFWRLIETRQVPRNEALLQRREAMQAFVTDFTAAASQIGLCHHDPTRSNFVGRNNQLCLLDWEYAANGPVVMDFAALSIEWCIDDAEMIRRVALDPALLDTAKTIYQYICELWTAVRN